MTVPNFLAKTSVQAVIAFMLVATTCYLAIDGKFEDAKGFAAIAIVPVLWLFRGASEK